MHDLMTNPKSGSLWQNSDFLKLWSGQTTSVFGSIIGGTAMSFTAVLFLQATPFQMALLPCIWFPASSQETPNMLREIHEGVRVVYQHSLLRSSAVVLTIISLSGGIFSALVVLYMGRELGFDPGILGMIWAVGGISSFFGASLTPYITRRLNPGPAMVVGLTLYSVCIFFIPLASGVTVLSAIFLIIQQLGDGFFVLYEINMVSFRQEIISERMLGRVNATLRFVTLGATLVGSLLGGLLGESLGVRTTLFVAAVGSLIGSAILALSPIGKLKKAASQE